ncbi:MAG: hypothetical protein O3A80_01415 [bacterium]|nr:hypothetical protein [bacterium]
MNEFPNFSSVSADTNNSNNSNKKYVPPSAKKKKALDGKERDERKSDMRYAELLLDNEESTPTMFKIIAVGKKYAEDLRRYPYVILDEKKAIYTKVLDSLADSFKPTLLPTQIDLDINHDDSGKVTMTITDNDSDQRIGSIYVDTDKRVSGGGDIKVIQDIMRSEAETRSKFKSPESFSQEKLKSAIESWANNNNSDFMGWNEKDADGSFYVSDEAVKKVKYELSEAIGFSGSTTIKVNGSRAGMVIKVLDKETGRTVLDLHKRYGADKIESLTIKHPSWSKK